MRGDLDGLLDDMSPEDATRWFTRAQGEEPAAPSAGDDEGAKEATSGGASELCADFEEFFSFLWLCVRVKHAHRQEGYGARVNDWLSTLTPLAPVAAAPAEPVDPTPKAPKGKKK